MDEGTRLPSKDLNTDAADIEDQGCDSSPELVELSAYEFFGSALQNAQKRVATAEGPRKCLHASRNQGKSDRTMRRNKKARRDLEAQGFLALPEFFKWKSHGCPAARVGKHTSVKNDVELVITLEEEEEEEEERGIDATPIHMCEEEEEEEAEVETGTNAFPIHVSEEEGHKEGETETEDETGKTNNKPNETTTDACSAEATPTPQSDPSDAELTGRCWGPSWTVLLESEESEHKSSNGNSTQSNLEDIHSTVTRELENHHRGDAPDDAAAQLPTASAADLLSDRARLQRVQRELTAKARLGDLDSVLQGHVMAMLRLLNLFLDDSLGYRWKKASEVVAKTEGCGTNHVQSIQQWVVKFAHTHELPSHRHG